MLLMNWQAILNEFARAQTFWLGLVFLLTYPLVSTSWRSGRRQHSWSLIFAFFTHLLLVPISASLRQQQMEHLATIGTFVYQLCALFMVVVIITRLVCYRLLPRLGLTPPQITHDLAVMLLSLFGCFVLAAQAGLNLAGVIATSAVVTAVIGLALQDTLGNVIGGMVLQFDKSLRVGDWVKLGDTSGRISEISWRYTAIETRNWETLIVPNSQLMKSQVLIMGKRSDPLSRWRRWVWFHVNLHYTPTEVIKVVTNALRNADIPNVASEPAINCVLMDFGDSAARYAVRYWLTDLAADDPTDSSVRIHLANALKRAGIPISIPAQTLYLNQGGDPGIKSQLSEQEESARLQIVSQISLFKSLTPDEQHSLADKLISAPFLSGEIITRQGAEGHWLYILAEGKVSIRLQTEAGFETEVNQIEAVGFFGEMSLMTGAPRGSTVLALTDVLCYRLDKESFQDILQQRPEIAENVAAVLAERRSQTELVSLLLAQEDHASHLNRHKHNILASIKAFFMLED